MYIFFFKSRKIHTLFSINHSISCEIENINPANDSARSELLLVGEINKGHLTLTLADVGECGSSRCWAL